MPDDDADWTTLVESAYPQNYRALKQYVDILTSKGVSWGLLGPREGARVWSRHILNSLALVDLLPEGVRVADVGSGAGLPGLPLAIVRPDIQVALLEPLLRRSTFLAETVDELGLSERVRVERLRAEDCDETFDVVTCRAVAPLDRLLKWTTPLFYPDGRLLALKGDSAADEVAAATSLLERSHLVADVLSVRALAQSDPTHAIRVFHA